MSLFTQKELSKYSLTKAIAELSHAPEPGVDGRVTGLEAECHDALKSQFRRLNEGTEAGPGFLIPIGALMPIKNLNVTTATAGGFLVSQDLDTIAPALRSASVVLSLGAQVFNNLSGDFGLPSETAFQTASWLGESEALPDSGANTFARTMLAPRRVASLATVSKQLLAQNSVGIETFVRDSLRATLGTALDAGALNGVGNKEPLGLLNNPNCSSITFGATPTRTKLVSFQDSLTTNNAGNLNQDSIAYVTSPTAASKLMLTSQTSGQARFLWEGNEWAGNVAGLPARSTTNVGSGNQMILGDWSQLVVAFWGESVSIITDPFTLKKNGLVEIVASMFADVAPRNAKNFVVSTDSAAQ
ncbi:MAG TPA: phage major capsid protein [Candidatus Udaeobacter sp.]|nr:phage major capsid protein [Candidatus Udaeobacter sp.]